MKLIDQIRLALVVIITLGCGRKELPYTDNSKDSELYARGVRTLVLGLADTARGSSEPRAQISLIVTELSHDDRPMGQYKPIYAEMLTTSQKILDRCPPGRGRAEIGKELDELRNLARKLPSKP
jgi:hypothetical protein